jgi:hypothetical protein
MSTEIDWNKVIAQVFVDLTKATLKGASAKVAGTLTSLLQAFQKDFEPYLMATLRKCSSVRTLLHRDEPVPLSDIYVKTHLKSSKRVFDDVAFIEALPEIPNTLIVGTAGSGKSIFLKYLFLALFERRRGKIPLFIELRQMNSLQSRNLISFMFHSVVTPGGILQRDGLFLTFSHRSFQEYFTAYFICRSPALKLSHVLDQLQRKTSDSVLRMAFDMNRNLIEREWILPKLKELNAKIAEIPEEHLFAFLNTLYAHPILTWSGDAIHMSLGEFRDWGVFRVTLYRFYTGKFEAIEERRTRSRQAFLEIVSRLERSNDDRVANISKDELHEHHTIKITEADDDLFAGTWIAHYVRDNRKLLRQLEAEVFASVSQQKSILDNMFD